jgi:pyruvate dehydrogenase (quinone)
MARVGDELVETLVNAGVKRMYGVPGDSLNGVTDYIRRHDKISWVHVRHEEVAAFAAGAEAHLTGQLVAVGGSCGPGNMHLINGLYDCQRNRVPVIAIAAHIPSVEIGSGYFQETDPKHLFAQCSHYCEVVQHPNQLGHVMETAIQTARTRRGVSVVILPGDISLQSAVESARGLIPETRSTLVPSEDDLARLATVLDSTEKITILGGAGCAGAHDELVALAGKLRAPIVHAYRGKEFIEYDNPFDVGMTGLLGFSSGYHAMQACELLLMLGTDFPYRAFYPEKARVVQIDLRGEQLGKRTRIDFGLAGDIKATLQALLPRLRQKETANHLETALQHYRKTRKRLDELAGDDAQGGRAHPQYLAKVLSEVCADDAVFTVDVGTPCIWAARYIKMNGQRRVLGSFNHGSMANALPQAIGAQAAYPGRQVISLSGDGGLSMLMGDLLTLRQQKLPVKVVVFRNECLGFVELEMKAVGFMDFGTDLLNGSFAKIAEGCGMLGLTAERPDQIRPMLKQALEYDGPALVEVLVNQQDLAMPPTITLEQMKGFSLFALRAVFSGRGDELVDLAKTNLFRSE